MTLHLNGQPREFDGTELALETLLQRLDLLGRPVIVEHNQSAIAPDRYPQVTLHDGDHVEIVRIAAGG